MAAPDESDAKEVMIAGCRVRLTFVSKDSRWTVEGTVQCGIAENSDEQSFRTGDHATQEDAEREALSQAGTLLGDNVDRNTSRVTNWS